MIKFNQNHNLVMEFANGFVLSLASGPGTYSCNRHLLYAKNFQEKNEVATIEVACWHKDDNSGWVRLSESDDVRGYCTADEVAEIIAIVSRATTAEEITKALI